MREILFRGKCIENGEWVYGYYAHIPCGRFKKEEHLIQTIKKDGMIGSLHDVIPDTVGQYTGLTAKNGVKIFEGDICEIDREDGRFEIIWDNPYARVALVSDELYFDFDNLYLNEIKVIGNVHDNPEFLEVKK